VDDTRPVDLFCRNGGEGILKEWRALNN
jgi:hypothetical protein